MAPLRLGIAVFAALLTLSSATPMSRSKTHPRSIGLTKRYNTIENCDAPLRDSDPDSGLNTQADLLGRATADMASLANIAFNHLSDQGTDSPAFQHYFLPVDLDLVKRLYGAVASNNDPTNAPFDFVISCAEDKACRQRSVHGDPLTIVGAESPSLVTPLPTRCLKTEVREP